jgi:hypothetical protein
VPLSETDLPPAAVAEIASIFARGYLRCRTSSHRLRIGSQNSDQNRAPDQILGLASLPQQSVHVTVVNAQSMGENG